MVTSLEDIIDPTDGVWTLQRAIYYAVEDTKIEFEPQLAHGYIVLNDTLYIDKPVEIDFSGITLNASHSFGALVVAESATLSNLNIRYGSAIYGSGIYATDLRLINGTISDSDGDRPESPTAAPFIRSVDLSLYETDIVNCYAFYGGAVYAEHGETKYGATASGDSGILILEDGTVSGQLALIGGAFTLTMRQR